MLDAKEEKFRMFVMFNKSEYLGSKYLACCPLVENRKNMVKFDQDLLIF